MIKKIVVALGFLFFIAMFACGKDATNIEKLFPEIEGWKKDGAPQTYTPETLFDYINGAADLYLSYDFEELTTLSFDSGQEKSLTIDIYRHSSQTNGFGIYSQEKSIDSDYLSIGSQGYYDRGILNFFKGRYYVKMMAFGLSDEEEKLLKTIARKIAGKLDDEAVFPTPVLCLPDKHKVKNSERYIAKDFLGHSFLHSAFIADYKVSQAKESQKFRVFIIEANDEADAKNMMEKYLAHATYEQTSAKNENGIYRLRDPYFKSQGTLNLMWKGKYIWGLFGDEAEIYEFYLSNIEERLTKNRLIS